MSIFPTKTLLATDSSEEAMLATSTAAELAGERKEQRMDAREVLGRKTCAAILRRLWAERADTMHGRDKEEQVDA
jgi:hypothetical protein